MEPTSYPAVGQRIRAAREQAGMSGERLAKLMGTTGATISRYELAQSKIPLPDMVKIAGILGVSPCYLLTGQDAPGSDSALWQYSLLSDEDKMFVRDMIGLLAERRRKAEAAA